MVVPKAAGVAFKKGFVAARRYTLSRIAKKRLNKGKHHQVTLKKNLEPGSVMILLSGRQKGRRVIFLKQLESGHLLYTSPKCLKGFGLGVIYQCFTIVTSTKVPLSDAVKTEVDKLTFAENFKTATKKKSEKPAIFAEGEGASKRTDKGITPKVEPAVETALDDALAVSIDNFSKDALDVQMLRQYLRQRFTLKNGQKPHNMKF